MVIVRFVGGLIVFVFLFFGIGIGIDWDAFFANMKQMSRPLVTIRSTETDLRPLS
jgi:hypothetical protein